MSFTDLFDSGAHKRNLGHFAAIVTLASSNGEITKEEHAMLERLARKLGVDATEYAEILETPDSFPINPPDSKAKRFERIYDLFKIIYADNIMDPQEEVLLNRYAIGLGFSEDHAKVIIARSAKIFGGSIPLEDYLYLLEKE